MKRSSLLSWEREDRFPSAEVGCTDHPIGAEYLIVSRMNTTTPSADEGMVRLWNGHKAKRSLAPRVLDVFIWSPPQRNHKQGRWNVLASFLPGRWGAARSYCTMHLKSHIKEHNRKTRNKENKQ